MKLNRTYRAAEEMPEVLPVFPVAGALLLPRRPIENNPEGAKCGTVICTLVASFAAVALIFVRAARRQRPRHQ